MKQLLSLTSKFTQLKLTGCFMLLVLLIPAHAQSAFDLSLAGVTMPLGQNMYSNPALSHQTFRTGTFTVPLPLGVFSLASGLSAENPDVFYLLDAAFRPASYLFNPVSGQLDGEFEADVDGEEPTLAFGFDPEELGDVGSLLQRVSQGVSPSVDLPLAFRLGGETFAIHPFADSYAQVKPETQFEAGSARVSLERVRLKLRAGVSADWLHASEISSSGRADIKRYVGFRLAPFIGLARVDADIDRADLVVDVNATEASYRLDAASYTSLVGAGGGGGGLITDWGLVDVVSLSAQEDAAKLVFGVSVQNLNISYWRGQTSDLVGEGSSTTQEASLDFVSESDSRFFLAPNLELLFHSAYINQVDNGFGVTVAGDLSVDMFSEALELALGAQGLWDTGFSEATALRAGVGWERGLKWGLGAGASWGWFGLDTALHSFQSPASASSVYGLAVSTRFNF